MVMLQGRRWKEPLGPGGPNSQPDADASLPPQLHGIRTGSSQVGCGHGGHRGMIGTSFSSFGGSGNGGLIGSSFRFTHPAGFKLALSVQPGLPGFPRFIAEQPRSAAIPSAVEMAHVRQDVPGLSGKRIHRRPFLFCLPRRPSALLTAGEAGWSMSADAGGR